MADSDGDSLELGDLLRDLQRIREALRERRGARRFVEVSRLFAQPQRGTAWRARDLLLRESPCCCAGPDAFVVGRV